MTMCTFSSGGYPLGAQYDKRAPYNQPEPKKVKVNVCISVTYSKSVDVIVDENYTNEDLRDAVEDMGILPNYILQECQNELIADLEENNWLTKQYDLESLKSEIQRHTPWHEDEFEVIENNFIPHE